MMMAAVSDPDYEAASVRSWPRRLPEEEVNRLLLLIDADGQGQER
jgi:hypothetical protein